MLKHTNIIETSNMTIMQGVIIQLVLLFQNPKIITNSNRYYIILFVFLISKKLLFSLLN